MTDLRYGLIFDLDGVIVDTAYFHYLAWKETAKELGFDLTEELNEQLKGVSRIDSLQKILDWADISIPEKEFDRLTQEKNENYLSYVDDMTKEDILPGVYNFLTQAKKEGYAIALGSASKNAKAILQKVELLEIFDALVDGNTVSKAKPDPEVFLKGAELLGKEPSKCIVFEDSKAGVTAANKGGMTSIGVGEQKNLGHAHYVIPNFNEIDTQQIEQLITIS